MLTRTIEQTIDDWFRNSPDWPMRRSEINVEQEADDFMRDETPYSREEIVAAMTDFVNSAE